MRSAQRSECDSGRIARALGPWLQRHNAAQTQSMMRWDHVRAVTSGPALQPRQRIGAQPWVVRGQIKIRHYASGAHAVWYAEDDDGVIALCESREELERALREGGHRTPIRSGPVPD